MKSVSKLHHECFASMFTSHGSRAISVDLARTNDFIPRVSLIHSIIQLYSRLIPVYLIHLRFLILVIWLPVSYTT